MFRKKKKLENQSSE